jgi:hypothetical protein
MLKRLLSLLSAKKPGAGEEKRGVETRRPLTPEQAYRKRTAKKRRKAQKKSRRRNRK